MATKRKKSGKLTRQRRQEIQRIIGLNNMSSDHLDLFNYSKALEHEGHVRMRSGGESELPQLVVWPSGAGQISRLLALATEHGINVVPYGAGSNLVGAATPDRGGIILDMKRLNRIVALDETSMIVTVQAGIIGETLEHELNESGFTLGHYPSSMYASTVGGWLAMRAAGHFSTRYGKIEDLVVALEATLGDGSIIQLKPKPRAAVGPDFIQFLVGGEGALAVITEASLRIHHLPETRLFSSFSFEKLEDGLETMRLIMRKGLRPAAIRLYDEADISAAFEDSPVEVRGTMMLLIVEGLKSVATAEMRLVENCAVDNGGVNLGPYPSQDWWRHHYDVAYRQSKILPKPGAVLDTIEVSSTWTNLLGVYSGVRKALEGEGRVMGHFSHAYPEGCSISFTISTETAENKSIATLDRIWKKTMDATVAAGGSISHHFGIGLRRLNWLPAELGELAEVLKRIKKEIDPAGILNPGKLGL